MTLTELRYAISVAQEHHFGRAAQLCHVSQPSLSVAIKKLEDELGVKLFERKNSLVMTTNLGHLVIEQAQRVLEEVDRIKECVQVGKDPLNGPLRLGVIHTIAPYLLPILVKVLPKRAPKMPLLLTEGYTHTLIEELKTGQIDCALLALPIDEPGLDTRVLYAEDFVVALPSKHPLATKEALTKREISDEPMLLLGKGHCLRDQILNFCFEPNRSDNQKKGAVTGTSLETIVHMVGQGLGITILPASATPYHKNNPLIKILPFVNGTAPKRAIALVWRKSFPRIEAINAVEKAVMSLNLTGCIFRGE